MNLDPSLIRSVAADFFRLTRKFAKLEKRAYDFGTGDQLYPSEIHTVEAIGDAGAATVTGLARTFGITKGAVSQTVAKLEAKGYVERRGAPVGTEEPIGLTEKGRTARASHARFHAAMDGAFAARLGDVDPADLAVLRRLLALIEDQVDAYAAQASR
jgi:DNA-binding MarR family transcriptional regulator